MKKTIFLLLTSFLFITGCQSNTKSVHICEATIDEIKYQTSFYASDDKVTKIISRVSSEITDDTKLQLFTYEAKNIEAQLENVTNISFNYELTDKLYTQTYTFETNLMSVNELKQYLIKTDQDFKYISKDKSIEKLEELGFHCQIRP